MSASALTFVDPGPFDQIIRFAFPATTFRFQIFRDDGLRFTPESEEGVEMSLYDDTWRFLFRGESWSDPELNYTEATPGLITSFDYRNNYYTITFNLTVVEAFIQRGRHNFLVYLITDGSRSLETKFPRCYTDATQPATLSEGNYNITIPLWDKTTDTTYPNEATTTKLSTLTSSVPYKARYFINNANASGRFLLPILAVTWSPNDALTSWLYELKITINCPGFSAYIPQQTIAGMTPPTNPPTSAEDREHRWYNNLILTMAFDSCPTLWNATRIEVTSSFGYSTTIPFAETKSTLFNDAYELPETFPPNGLGKTFSRSHQFVWDQTTFQYDTGIWPIFNFAQVASMVQSPHTGYDALIFYPEPE